MSRLLFVFACVTGCMLGACTKSHDVLAAGASLGSAGDQAGSDAAGSGSAAAGSGGTNVGVAGSSGAAGSNGVPGNAGGGCVDCMAGGVSGLLTLPACCAKNAAGADVCGLDVSQIVQGAGCLERNAPGTADMSCPASMQMGITLQGCCRADGTCGSMDTFLGLGCSPNADGTKKACGTGPG